MTDRRGFINRVALGFIAAPLTTEAQQAGKVHRIGCLSSGTSPDAQQRFEVLRQGLRELGWVDGQNIVIEYRIAEGRFDRLPDLAAELVRHKVDIIVAVPTPAAVAAKKATAAIPIVMIGVADPVGLGLIASLARPGGNVTGLSWSVGVELWVKQLELLKEILPKDRRVAILSNPANPFQALAIEDLKVAARSLGLRLQLLETRSPDEFDGAFAAMAKEHAGAVLVISDTIFSAQRARIADLEAKNQLPSMHGLKSDAEAGALMAYGPNFPDQFRRAAIYVDKILKGANPADLPAEQPTTFELVINMKTAKALGLTIPQSLLLRADEMIQ